MTLLTSRQNPKLKLIRALRQRKQRKAQGLFVVEGLRHLGEAAESNSEIEYVLYSADLLTSEYGLQLISRLEGAGISIFKVPADILEDLSGKDNPAGIMGVVKQKAMSIDQIGPENFSWGVVVEDPQDPGNLGTILRTLDAAGADGLVIVGGGVDVYHPTAVRASMGTLFWKPVVSVGYDEFFAWLNVNTYNIYGTSAKAKADYREAAYTKPVLLMLGRERDGLSEEMQAVCQQVLSLPMRGRSTSLNLSVAAGIMLYSMGESLDS